MDAVSEAKQPAKEASAATDDAKKAEISPKPPNSPLSASAKAFNPAPEMNVWERRAKEMEEKKRKQEEDSKKEEVARKKDTEDANKKKSSSASPKSAAKAGDDEPSDPSSQALQELPKCVEGDTALHCTWSFWFDKRVKSSKSASSQINYREHLNHLCCFASVENFWRYYLHLVKPSELPKDSNLQLFRESYYPMWESFPHGGCWILKVWKDDPTHVDAVWETLVKMAVGEIFEEPDMVGIVLSVRNNQDMISIWTRKNEKESVFRIGEKLKEMLMLSPTTVLEYKKHLTSIKDNSTYRNTKTYVAGMPSPALKPARK